MLKRIILSASDKPLDAVDEHAKYSIATTEAYAKKHGIDFEYLEVKSKPRDRDYEWAKVPVIGKFIEKYDEILWVNPDATIIQFDTDVFEYLKTAPQKDKAVWPIVDGTKPIAYAIATDKTVSTAVVLLDAMNKTAARDFLNDWWNDLDNMHYEKQSPWGDYVWNIVWRKDARKTAKVRAIQANLIQEFDKGQPFIHLSPLYKGVRAAEAKRYFYRLVHNRNEKIGIYVRQQNYYSSGCGQNCIFIKQSLEALGYEVDLIVQYDPKKPSMVADHIPYIYKAASSVNFKDYSFILFGSQIPTTAELKAIKDAGVRTAVFHPMNSLDMIHSENFIWTQTGLPLFEATFQNYADEVWMTENHRHTAQRYTEILNDNKIPVRIIPLSWSPLFSTTTTMADIQYQPRNPDNKIDVVIIEPNLSYAKNAWYPLVIAKRLHKEGKLNKVYLFNKPASAAAKKMIAALDLPMRQLDRLPIYDIFKFFCKGVNNDNNNVLFISHQLNVPNNYAYNDILNAGYPFLHNSPILKEKGLGYYYSDADLDSAVAQAMSAICKPISDSGLKTYIAENDPYSPNVLARFNALLNRPKIQTVVISVNEERKAAIQKQLEILKFPYPVHYFKGSTVEDSKSWILEDYPVIPPLQCCAKSHIDGLDWYVNNSLADYVLVLEDDAAILKDGFSKAVEDTIALWNEEIDYISIGYIPDRIKTILPLLKNTQSLYWGFKNISQTIWGTQSYIVKRSVAFDMVHITKRNTCAHVKNIMDCFVKEGRCIANKIPYVQADALFPLLFRQAICYPLLVIETEAVSIISNKVDRLWANYEKENTVKLEDYYKAI